MALVTLTCPHCNFFKDVDMTLLPPAGTTVNCPVCQGQFPLEIAEPQAPVEPYPPMLEPYSTETDEPSFEQQAMQTAEPFEQQAMQTAEPFEQQAMQTAEPLDPDMAPPPPPPLSPTQAAAPKRPRTLTFSFTGNAKEYFGIWIVNTLLRVVTFGIYSPWAKVRKRRYFYGNTLLDKASFDYLADPLAILKGWFLAGAFFGLYSLASNTSPIASVVMMLAFLGLYPWVIVRSRIFNLRNSSHRNIRFSFKPDYRESYNVYLWWSLLVPLTLGILTPYVLYRQRRFLVEKSSFGTTPFSFDATHKQYYRIFLPVLWLVPLVLAAGGLIYMFPKEAANPALVPVVSLAFLAAYLVAALYIPTAITNLTWNSTSIGGHRFQSKLRVRDLAWIYLSSAVAVLCSLGLLAPWAAVRLAKYRLEKTTLTGVGSLDSIVAAENEAMGATGEELGDMLGFDLAL